jgi:branched-chain amino acid aminotransferase
VTPIAYNPAMQTTEWIWRDGEFIPWAQATTHVMTHALHYGSAVFEGIRAYDTAAGTRFFRLDAHIERLCDSARAYAMPMRWSQSQLEQACRELVRRNKMKSAYVRPLVFRGYGTMGLDPTPCPVETIIAAWDWGKYLTAGKGADEGIDVCVSSWQRVAPNTLPAMAKAAGNYLSSQLIRLEATRNGYAEGLALCADGTISEASGENVFLVKHDLVLTPDHSSSILLGITRDSVIRIAEHLGYTVREERLPREMLYAADEVFLTGTAAEITPVRSIDRIVVGDGRAGPVTRAVQRTFFGLFDHSTPDRWDWLSDLGPS